MKILNPTFAIFGFCLLLTTTITAQELAAFRVPDSNRSFVFIGPPSLNQDRNWLATGRPSSNKGSTNDSAMSIQGLQVVLAKRFNVTRQSDFVNITFYDVVFCRGDRSEGPKSDVPVVQFNELTLSYPVGTRVLVRGHSVRLADLTKKSFDSPKTEYNEIYSGEAAIKKLKEMGLEPPEDMDPNWRTRKDAK